MHGYRPEPSFTMAHIASLHIHQIERDDLRDPTQYGLQLSRTPVAVGTERLSSARGSEI